MAENRISLNISQADQTRLHEALQTIQSILGPHLKSLSPDDRREMAKMGDKTIAFVVKALEYARKNPALVPNYLDLAEFGKDVEGVVSLRNWEQTVTGILTALDDSLTLAGSEAYQAALIFYASVRVAAKNNVTGAQSIYDDLSTRFPGAPTKKKV